MNSSRLPGKVLRPFCDNQSIIEILYKKMKNSDNVEVILATSSEKSDDILADFAGGIGYKVYRGDLTNVAKRALDCCNQFNLDFFARVNGDSPFINYDFIKSGITRIKENSRIEFVTNLYPRSFPYGYSLEIISARLFGKLYPDFDLSEQEHITKALYKNINNFYFENINSVFPFPTDCRLTIDTIEDFNFWNTKLHENPNLFFLEINQIVSLVC